MKSNMKVLTNYFNLIIVELGFVIGKQAKNINKEDYADYVDNYFVCLDVTDKTFQKSIFNYLL
jgi:2-keto-4-pentenoate hydratase/2-oxohepta-3-ene-1,7-dioic acid hydratase in catechol pathway